MSQVFRHDGVVVPVTVVLAGPCSVTQLRAVAVDGYDAVQLGFQGRKNPNKPMRGHVGNAEHQRFLREFPVEDIKSVHIGQQITVELFEQGELVDVVGTSKGKGFQGVVKRHGFAGGPRTHGQSDRLRAPGSIGGGTTPGRVYKGKPMAGHMGNARVTAENLEVVQVDPERNLLLLKGGVPGAPNSLVVIRKTKKAPHVGVV
jgi:large subunit ribosomal protein L3